MARTQYVTGWWEGGFRGGSGLEVSGQTPGKLLLAGKHLNSSANRAGRHFDPIS
jgi:hypothetical protein